MRTNEHLVLCGGHAPRHDARALELRLHGPAPNVKLRLQDLSDRLLTDVPDQLVDLLEIAAYVYAADNAVSRGGLTDAGLGARWRRTLRFEVPVRQPELWASAPVRSALTETLGYLSDDDYHFEFTALRDRSPLQTYLEFSGQPIECLSPDQVVLFSGALDDLVSHGKSVALVSHRSSTKIAAAQKHLVDALRARLGRGRVLHVPVWLTGTESIGSENTHRTRSLVFAALGAVTARLLGLDNVRFFENGVLSFNLPPVAQVVGGRATRTTHPQSLAGFQRLFREAIRANFSVENPFVWMTKADVIQRIADSGFADEIRYTRSCTRVHEMTTLHPHCGKCSQCIDRRFATLAAGLDQEDPPEAYKVELFTGDRPPDRDREMALSYVRTASLIDNMADLAFFAQFGEVSRAVGFFEEATGVVAERIFRLHQRHARGVCQAFDAATSAHAAALREGRLPGSCLLKLVISEDDARRAAYRSDMPQQERTSPQRGRTVRIAVEDERVIIDRWGEIKGAEAKLIVALAEPHRRATVAQRAPENYPFMPTGRLAEALGVETEETVRRQVTKCRKRIGNLAAAAGDLPTSLGEVIESQQSRGYRLNPDTVRIVASDEIRRGD